jgi:competence protein ComEC
MHSAPEDTLGKDDFLPAGGGFIKGIFSTLSRSVLLKLGCWKPDEWAANRRRIAGIIAVLAVLALAADTCFWVYQRFWHSDLRVTVIDVGQGSAALVELPGGHNMLFDGGGFSDNSVFDMGARVVAPFLWQKKIKTIHTVVLSHPNSDHLNGLIYIAKHFNVRTVWTNNEISDTNAQRQFSEVIAAKNITIPRFQELPRQQEINGVVLSIIYPPKDFIEKKTTQKWRNLNNNSLVVRLLFGSISILFPGDIMADAEKELVRICRSGIESTILLAPHHGSKTSSTGAFLDRISPRVVIVSSGRKTSTHYPHATVLQRYRDRNCRVYRTDTHGAILIQSNGQQLVISPQVSG